MKWFGASLVFISELGMLAGFAWWGFHVADGVAGWVLAVAAPAVAVTLWGQFLAPKAPHPLKGFLLVFVRHHRHRDCARPRAGPCASRLRIAPIAVVTPARDDA